MQSNNTNRSHMQILLFANQPVLESNSQFTICVPSAINCITITELYSIFLFHFVSKAILNLRNRFTIHLNKFTTIEICMIT